MILEVKKIMTFFKIIIVSAFCGKRLLCFALQEIFVDCDSLHSLSGKLPGRGNTHAYNNHVCIIYILLFEEFNEKYAAVKAGHDFHAGLNYMWDDFLM